MIKFVFYFQLGPSKIEEETEGAEEEETLEKWRLARMEKEKWMQEFEKKQYRKRGYEEEEEDVAGEIENDSQFFQMAEKTLMRMTSKDDTVVNSPSETESVAKVPAKDFKSPHSKFGPLQPLQNMVRKSISVHLIISTCLFREKQFEGPLLLAERSLLIRSLSSVKSRMTRWAAAPRVTTLCSPG